MFPGFQKWLQLIGNVGSAGKTVGAGQTVKRQMVTYRIMAFGKELAGFGQVGNALETLFPLATILRRSQSDGEK